TTSGQTASAGGAGAVGLTNTQMLDPSSFVGFDFTTPIWLSGYNGSPTYPYFFDPVVQQTPPPGYTPTSGGSPPTSPPPTTVPPTSSPPTTSPPSTSGAV